jgi:FkbM family methyltransferase
MVDVLAGESRGSFDSFSQPLWGVLVTNFDLQLEALLAEGVDGARQREAAAADSLRDLAANGVVLFGAGNLGGRTLAGLRAIGVEPLCFVDNNELVWGNNFQGIPIMSPVEGAERYGSHATFIVTIWRAQATERMVTRVEQLRRLECNTVIPFLPLYWKYPALFLPHYMHDLPHRVHPQADRVREALALMADDFSRSEYLAQMRFRLLGEFDALRDPVPGQIYFRDELFSLSADETFVDCGAFDGDTLQLFLEKSSQSFKRVIAFEPDPENYGKLEHKVTCLPADVRGRIEIRRNATGKANTRVLMDAGKGVSSKIGAGDCEVDSVSLDSVLNDEPVTFIKMDIEGSELATLAGAKELIRKHKPILAISAYHQQSDLWNIPLFIQEINPNYSFYLRPHVLDGWDLVCYAVPPDRRPTLPTPETAE